MSAPQGRNEASTAWNHFRQTGVILPDHQSEIAAALATRAESTATEDEATTDETQLTI